MNLRKLTGVAVAAVLALPMFASGANAYELVIPTLDYRTGPYAPNGIPVANGFTDYLNMLNERDGGINGVKIKHVDCETGYTPKKVLSATKRSRTRRPQARSRSNPCPRASLIN